MAGIQTLPETGPLKGLTYLDESGGYIVVAVQAAGYIAQHRLHVAAFDAAGGAYTTVGTGQEANVVQTAENVVAQIATLYDATCRVQAVSAYQVTADHTGALPTALDLSAASAAGTNTAGYNTDVFNYTGFTAHGADFSRWQLHLHATNSADQPGGNRCLLGAFSSTKCQNLGNYLLGLQAGLGIGGSGTGLFTQIVTHAGMKLVQPMYVIGSYSKRIRRRYRTL